MFFYFDFLRNEIPLKGSSLKNPVETYKRLKQSNSLQLVLKAEAGALVR